MEEAIGAEIQDGETEDELQNSLLTDQVVFDDETKTIGIPGWGYYLNAGRCKTADELVDRIAKLHRKYWMTPEMMHDVLTCLFGIRRKIHE